MPAENSEMLVFLSVFPNNAHFSSFLMVAWEKKQKKVTFHYFRPTYIHTNHT